MSITRSQTALREFATQREWEQFHTPKNLVMALANEAGELLKVFQWLTPEQSLAIMKEPATAEHVGEEVADFYDIHLERAPLDKIQKNVRKYPVEIAPGSAAKYIDLGKVGQL